MSRINHKENKLQCSRCGEWKPKVKDFYMSQSKMYENNDKRIPLCKICLNERYEELYEKYNDEMKAMHHWCVNFDVYFSEANFESAFSQAGRDGNVSIIGIYMKNANSMKQNKGKTSLHSEIIVNQVEEIKDEVMDNKNSAVEVTNSIRKKWGREYTDEECLQLEDYYDYYYNTYNHDNDASKLDFIREVCTFKLIISQAKKKHPIDHKVIKEFHGLIQQTLNGAGLSPSQKKAHGTMPGDVLGVDIRDIIENNEPFEDVLPQFKDVDKIEGLMTKTFYKPFAKVYGLASDSKEA